MSKKEARKYVEDVRSKPETREMDATGMVVKDFSKGEACQFSEIMDESKAREIIGYMEKDDRFTWDGIYESFDEGKIWMEDFYSADELEAIAWWMRNKSINKC